MQIAIFIKKVLLKIQRKMKVDMEWINVKDRYPEHKQNIKIKVKDMEG